MSCGFRKFRKGCDGDLVHQEMWCDTWGLLRHEVLHHHQTRRQRGILRLPHRIRHHTRQRPSASWARSTADAAAPEAMRPPSPCPLCPPTAATAATAASSVSTTTFARPRRGTGTTSTTLQNFSKASLRAFWSTCCLASTEFATNPKRVVTPGRAGAWPEGGPRLSPFLRFRGGCLGLSGSMKTKVSARRSEHRGASCTSF